MARHVYARGVGTIDTVVAQAQFVPPSSCDVYGFAATGTSGVPAWNLSIPQCDVGLLYDVDLMVSVLSAVDGRACCL
jgi:hypothetical protein